MPSDRHIAERRQEASYWMYDMRATTLVRTLSNRAIGILGFVLLAATIVKAVDPLPPDARIASLLATIAEAGPQGVGSAAARTARDELAMCDIAVLPALLEAMDTDNFVAANWYRTVYEEIAARESARPEPVWPKEFLRQYVNDVRRQSRPRRLVLALLDRLQPGFSATWLPTRLDDPEFGGEAVALALEAGAAAQKVKDIEAAKRYFRQAFDAARDSKQVSQAASKLRSLGETADAVRHLGLVVDWRLLGPFDAPEKTGFATAFPPETALDLSARYDGQDGKSIAWIWHKPKDLLGQINLNDVLGTTREAVGYAYAEVDVPVAVAAEVRCGADDNCIVWLNGAKVLAREQWLNGTRFDRFRAPVALVAGRNTLLVKVCQGPQHKDPEVQNNWSLQLRLCDADGRAIAFEPVTAPMATNN